MERVTTEGVGRKPGGWWRITLINVDQLDPLGVSSTETARRSSAALLGTTVTHSGTGGTGGTGGKHIVFAGGSTPARSFLPADLQLKDHQPDL